MLESNASSKFVLHRARISGAFDSRKDSYLMKFEQRSQIFVKLSLREFCDSNLSGLYPFDNMAIIHGVKNCLRRERQTMSSWDTNFWSNFCGPHWELISCNKWHPRSVEISTPEISVGAHFHAQHDTKTIQDFYLLIEKPFGCCFQLWCHYYHVAQRNQKTPIPLSSSWQVKSEKSKKGQASTLSNWSSDWMNALKFT